MPAVELIQTELEHLVKQGHELIHLSLCQNCPEKAKRAGLDCEKHKGLFGEKYSNWYTKCVRTLHQLSSDRLEEFVGCYEPDPRRKSFSAGSYKIQDFILGLRHRFDDFDTFSMMFSRLQLQVAIIIATRELAASKIYRIQSIIEAELIEREIDVADEPFSKKHLRAAGAICGVLLKGHFSRVCASRSIVIRKKDPTIADYNEALKAAEIIDIPTWRLIQRFADIRNMCVHHKSRDPTDDEVRDLLVGTKKLVTEIM